ncbi:MULTISPECIES: DUF397 domain-containing protein [Actinosynnema]|uniref:DUF397 domain-containing protein n=1 Tax=Actinosynnema TaxID=40566 RepID=UPI0020A4150F|nr:DUF397 domain-containing protein [Actinosynnema pretiosum]MCP2099137.1 protein of unknown function (DUF397) [Actinosynnema pretiosum]
MQWRTSSYTNGGNDPQCVECGHTGSGERFAVRDSKNRSGPALSFSPSAFRAFLDRVRTTR